MERVTAAIKTFERPDRMNRIVDSIKEFYPTMPIIVADDSKRPTPRKDVDYHCLPFDIGLSAGRNYMLEQVTTEYVLILDDDWVFVPQTRIEKMIRIIENNDIDILAGDWSNNQPTICAEIVPHDDSTILELKSKEINPEADFTYCDFTHNFLLTKPETLLSFGGWDNELKVMEHVDFALRVKENNVKLALTTKVAIHFTQTLKRNEDNMNYKKYRQRKHFMKTSMKKRGIKKLINYTGRTKYY